MTLKMNWGTRITALYIGFVVFMVALVTAASNREVNLVAENYYEQEIGFQKRLDASKAANGLKQPVSLTLRAGEIDIELPAVFEQQPVTAEVKLYAPTGAAGDQTFAFQTSDAHLHIPRKGLKPMQYEVQVSWQLAGKAYYQALPLKLQ
jgi:hypothetical protein